MKILTILMLLLLATVAYAGPVDARKACEPDVQKFCKEISPGGGRIIKCLKEHAAELSTECKEKGDILAGESVKDKKFEIRAEWQDACSEDVKTLCGDVKPGEGRLIECIKSKVDSLSASCKAQIEKSKDRFQSK